MGRNSNGKSGGTNHKKVSEFASAVAALVDLSRVHTRLEWAKILGVTTPAISQWTNDISLPRPSNLKKLVDTVRSAEPTAVTIAVLKIFDGMASKKATEVSPNFHGRDMTVDYYYRVAPLIDDFVEFFHQLPPKVAEKLLLGAAKKWEKNLDKLLSG